MTGAEPPDSLRRLRLRYAGVCVECGLALSKGADAWYDKTRRKVVCLVCGPTSIGSSAAGASAHAEGDSRRDKRVEDVRKKYGDHAAEVAKKIVGDEMASTWGKGGDGESRLAAYVAQKVGDRVIALHDRLIPGTRANIDHLWVAPTGVWIVDAKAHSGKVEKRRGELYVKNRSQQKLVNGMGRQKDAVRAALELESELEDIDVFVVLCFVEADWGLLDFPFSVGSVWVTYPGALARSLKKSGKVSRETMELTARLLDQSLPRAT